MEKVENDWSRKAESIRGEIVNLLGTVYPGQIFDMQQMEPFFRSLIRLAWVCKHMDGLAKSYKHYEDAAGEGE
jgi:hypothetical protein